MTPPLRCLLSKPGQIAGLCAFSVTLSAGLLVPAHADDSPPPETAPTPEAERAELIAAAGALEARIVKEIFQAEARGCICPPRFPVCTCGRKPRVELLTRKGVKPGPGEIDQNPRARSAVLRAVRRL